MAYLSEWSPLRQPHPRRHHLSVMTVGELMDAMQPAPQEILTPEELAETTTRLTWSAVAPTGLGRRRPMSDDEPLLPDALLEISTFGEHKSIWVDGEETAAEAYERVRSDLQDIVAESKFGWGQLRP